MRTETKLGLVTTYLLLSACGTGDEINPDGRGGAAGKGGVAGGGRNTGGQIIGILPVNTGGAGATGGARNTGGEIYSILPPISPSILPVTGGSATTADARLGSRQGTDEDEWWQAAEAALRSG
jgi:hypothetical protein